MNIIKKYIIITKYYIAKQLQLINDLRKTRRRLNNIKITYFMKAKRF